MRTSVRNGRCSLLRRNRGGEVGCTLSAMIFRKRYRKIREIITGAIQSSSTIRTLRTAAAGTAAEVNFPAARADRLTYKAVLVDMAGDSYRLREILRSNKLTSEALNAAVG